MIYYLKLVNIQLELSFRLFPVTISPLMYSTVIADFTISIIDTPLEYFLRALQLQRNPLVSRDQLLVYSDEGSCFIKEWRAIGFAQSAILTTSASLYYLPFMKPRNSLMLILEQSVWAKSNDDIQAWSHPLSSNVNSKRCTTTMVVCFYGFYAVISLGLWIPEVQCRIHMGSYPEQNQRNFSHWYLSLRYIIIFLSYLSQRPFNKISYLYVYLWNL
jgi:hypothetical protein